MHTRVITHKAFDLPKPFAVIEIKIGRVLIKTGQRILNYIRGIITSVIMVVLGYHGLDVMMKAFKRNQVTYVLQMPKGVLYAIAMICIVVALVVWVVLMLCNKGDFDHDNA